MRLSCTWETSLHDKSFGIAALESIIIVIIVIIVIIK